MIIIWKKLAVVVVVVVVVVDNDVGDACGNIYTRSHDIKCMV